MLDTTDAWFKPLTVAELAGLADLAIAVLKAMGAEHEVDGPVATLKGPTVQAPVWPWIAVLASDFSTVRPPILAIHGHFAPLPKKQAERSSADPGRNMSSSSYPPYSVFWDDMPIVTDRAHGVVNGRGIGRYITTISNPSTNGGPMSIDNLLVTATEAEPIPAVLAFLNQPTQGNPGQVLSPSAELAVVNAFDKPIIFATTVNLEIASFRRLSCRAQAPRPQTAWLTSTRCASIRPASINCAPAVVTRWSWREQSSPSIRCRY